MSVITGISDLGMSSRLVYESGQIKQQLDKVTEQSSTGLISSSYSGLGSGAIVSLTLNPQITQANTWQANIDSAGTRMSATQNVMTQLSSIASQFSSDLLDVTSTSSNASIDTIAAQARSALQQVGSLLNTQVGNDYIFSGQDTSNPAVPNASNILNTSFFSSIQTAIQGLAAGSDPTSSAAAANAATAAVMTAAQSSSNSPFDPTIGSTVPTVQVGTGQYVKTGLLANQNAEATSTPSATSTGSYMLDLMTALASIGSLSSSQVSLGQSYQDLLSNIGSTLSSAQQGLTTDSAILGSRQDTLTTRKTDLSDTVTALTNQVTNVEDVDMATTATRLSNLQTQLQASYKVLGDINQFSLVNFMSN
jgi:flagellar hook-associated protein 3 FlgL